MDIKEAVEKRHSVRQYLDKPIDDEKTQILEKQIEKCNQEGDLNIQLILNEPRAFQSQSLIMVSLRVFNIILL